MRGALESSAARPLKDRRKALGRALVFGSVEPEAYDPLMPVRQDVVEHALGHCDIELAIDRRNEPRPHPKVLVRRREALDKAGELGLIRDAIGIVVARVEEELDIAQIANAVPGLDVLVGDTCEVAHGHEAASSQPKHLDKLREIPVLVQRRARPR
jgi:hypothetical protein